MEKRELETGKRRPDTRHKMRLVCVLFTFEKNAGPTDLRTDGPTDERTDTPSYRDATAHLKTEAKTRMKGEKVEKGKREKQKAFPLIFIYYTTLAGE